MLGKALRGSMMADSLQVGLHVLLRSSMFTCKTVTYLAASTLLFSHDWLLAEVTLVTNPYDKLSLFG
ncbi:MAG TPA: hypothetical protein VK909_04170 [Anaerolineales bacterium]|nr:hypothetical protein [Anaerolineales bacterium]